MSLSVLLSPSRPSSLVTLALGRTLSQSPAAAASLRSQRACAHVPGEISAEHPHPWYKVYWHCGYGI
eukprot:1169995-Rhodomonas_salina.1